MYLLCRASEPCIGACMHERHRAGEPDRVLYALCSVCDLLVHHPRVYFFFKLKTAEATSGEAARDQGVTFTYAADVRCSELSAVQRARMQEGVRCCVLVFGAVARAGDPPEEIVVQKGAPDTARVKPRDWCPLVGDIYLLSI